MTPPSPSSSASESDPGEWLSGSSSSSQFSEDDAAEAEDVFVLRDIDGSPRQSAAEQSSARQANGSPSGRRGTGFDIRDEKDRVPFRVRGRHGRKTSISGVSDQNAQAYADVLRSSRASSHRASISVGSVNTSNFLSEETRRRHRDSKKRMEQADLTQELLFRANELDQFNDDVSVWLHASVIPPRWRLQVQDHLDQIHDQMQFCRDRVAHAWHLLLPPFDRANMTEYETRLRLFERSVTNYEAAIRQCQDHISRGERESASVFLQLWYRRCLARRGFYTKTLRVTRQSRGLIPALFDTIAGTSRLTIHPASNETKLEYPRTLNDAKHAFRK